MSGNWEQYFECKTNRVNGKSIKRYVYKDKGVKTLPANLPMPPTDTLHYIFSDCYQLEDISALANWDVSNVKDMSYMFYNCYQLQDITALANWNVSNVENMGYMFSYCSQLQDITALANWDVSNVKDMHWVFYGCGQLQDITALANWDVSKVENMEWMFSYCYKLQNITPLAKWDVSNVKEMGFMFSGCGQLNIPNDTNSIKSHIRNLPKRSYPKQDHTHLLQSLWERVKPLLKDTTKLNGYFKQYIYIENLPSDWQNIELIQWNP
jgi:surface protein